MKRFLNFIISFQATLALLITLIAALAAATFIEDKYDTVTARTLVYEAKWFELIFFLLAVNLIGNIKKHQLLHMKKVGQLLFHLAFILMIIGAGISRYFGYNGMMHIREGGSSNKLYSADTYLTIHYQGKKENFHYERRIDFGAINRNSFHLKIPATGKEDIDVRYKGIIPNAVTEIKENVQGGKDIIALAYPVGAGLKTVYIEKGETQVIDGLLFSYHGNQDCGAVNIAEVNQKLCISAPSAMIRTNMREAVSDTIMKDSVTNFIENYVYKINEVVFLFQGYFRHATKRPVTSTEPGEGADAVMLDIEHQGQRQEVLLYRNNASHTGNEDHERPLKNLHVKLGSKLTILPFSLFLKDFIIERYPGSESPSSYKSEITLIDARNKIRADHSIFMNHVLDYDHFRFFQSSYDSDEQGTILSVSHDFSGTLLTYAGYILLAAGFIITLFQGSSRFFQLRKMMRETRIRRKAIAGTMVLLSAYSFAYGQSGAISAGHADQFGQLLVQTFDGRFAPVHTMALDVIHKISRNESIMLDGTVKINAMQAFTGMMAEPEFWQKQKIIYIPRKDICEMIGIRTNYASFLDFFDSFSNYKLEKYVFEAFRKKQDEKSRFDREILKLDERLNILQMVMNGRILKIFPQPGAKNHKWISWDDKDAGLLLKGHIESINQELQLEKFNYSSLMQRYVQELLNASKTGHYEQADKIVQYISDIQQQLSDPSVLPSKTKIRTEIFYNKAEIFIFLKNLFAILSLLLLLFSFIANIISRASKFVSIVLDILLYVVALGFAFHTAGMGLRWYITGHAPWANGYEALILVAWGALLAGMIFGRKSKMTLAATALLAFLALMTASHSSYDPQLTNLQPVLRSYWLIIHVATLTVSYGFLGLGFILSLMNFCILLFKNRHNSEKLDLLVTENTYIVETNLITGLFLATAGTFLGAVWANESWGRYWGWDAKETWALIIILTYTIILHLRFIPALNSRFILNVASVTGFSSVLMTFIGVNYYFSKGIHSYGSGETPVFPLWAWCVILTVFALIIAAGIKEKKEKDVMNNY